MNCKLCGSPLNPNAKFCEFCGAKIEAEAPIMEEPVVEETVVEAEEVPAPYTPPVQDTYSEPKKSYSGQYYSANNGIGPRNIILAVVLYFVTCGLYGIYWMIKINDEVNELAGESGATSGGLVFLFSLITCGIYGLYWMYKMGERCDTIKGSSGSTGILYLILALLGFGIINYCLMQDTVNKAVS